MPVPLLEECLPAYSFVDIVIIMPVCNAVFDTFQPLTWDVLARIIHKLQNDLWVRSFSNKIFDVSTSIINIILLIVNLCFSSGDFPASCMSERISPLITKTRSGF